ncbi:hypothetical protein M758_2G197600 [Ceratodon purpureus]|nr:hypothetical protein M758_2G197600 [Ceratodon purpureus]
MAMTWEECLYRPHGVRNDKRSYLADGKREVGLKFEPTVGSVVVPPLCSSGNRSPSPRIAHNGLTNVPFVTVKIMMHEEAGCIDDVLLGR